MDFIKIRGARTHNLKNINLDLPRNRLTVITGLSGSGKSSSLGIARALRPISFLPQTVRRISWQHSSFCCPQHLHRALCVDSSPIRSSCPGPRACSGSRVSSATHFMSHLIPSAGDWRLAALYRSALRPTYHATAFQIASVHVGVAHDGSAIVRWFLHSLGHEETFRKLLHSGHWFRALLRSGH